MDLLTCWDQGDPRGLWLLKSPFSQWVFFFWVVEKYQMCKFLLLHIQFITGVVLFDEKTKHWQCGPYHFKPILLWIPDLPKCFRDALPRSDRKALLFEMEITVEQWTWHTFLYFIFFTYFLHTVIFHMIILTLFCTALIWVREVFACVV